MDTQTDTQMDTHRWRQTKTHKLRAPCLDILLRRRHTHEHTDRDTCTDTQTDTQTETHVRTHRQTHRQTYRWTLIDGDKRRPTNRGHHALISYSDGDTQTDTQTEAHVQTHRQAYRPKHTHGHTD